MRGPYWGTCMQAAPIHHTSWRYGGWVAACRARANGSLRFMAKRYCGLRCEVREENVSGLKTVTISALTRRRAMAGGTAALIVAPSVIRPGFAQSPAVNIGVI